MWRVWQAEQAPRLPSRLMRPTPWLGQPCLRENVRLAYRWWRGSCRDLPVLAVETGSGWPPRASGEGRVAAFELADDGLLVLGVEGVVGQVPVGMGHDVAVVLVRLLAVAGGAVPRADHHVDIVAVVVEGVGMRIGPQGVALGAAHGGFQQVLRDCCAGDLARQTRHRQGRRGGGLGMAAGLPSADDPGVDRGVAVQAFLGGVADGGCGRNCGRRQQQAHYRGGHGERLSHNFLP
ncbi:MAG: hypothetical protein U5J82_12300 [Desulfobacterales bacterium]|nr:hypothetical protein [Desulfobacterales bacterium]